MANRSQDKKSDELQRLLRERFPNTPVGVRPPQIEMFPEPRKPNHREMGKARARVVQRRV